MTIERATGAIALASIASPLWLAHVSEIAALLLPIAGVIWLLVQSYVKLTRKED
jgi:hypothetical protein